MKRFNLFKRNGDRRTTRTGVVTVEFAICAPIFFLVVFACFEFAWLQVMRHTADNAAYEAVRHIVVPGASASEALARTQEIMNSVGARGVTATITPSVITDDTDEVTVQVVVPTADNTLAIGHFSKQRQLVSSATMRTERGD